MSKRIKYDCLKCPAYCCSYPRIEVKPKDIKRLADHFGMSEKDAKRKFTKRGEEKNEVIMRHQKDEHYGTICRFIDLETRNCTVHTVRPAICREFPGRKRCGYYDFLTMERDSQEDPEYISTTNNV